MDIIEHRRALHRIPELDRNLPRTMEYLRSALQDRGCRVFSPAEGSLAAWFDFGRESSVAFRADADALPIQETTGLPFASQHPGQMHACGHDGHMAILLGLAKRISRRDTMPHNILLLFQCAEETTGGAKAICDSGIFEEYKTKAIFGLHLWPGLEKEKFLSCPGGMMCRSSQVRLDVTGRSAHIAKASEGIDAMAAAVAFYKRATRLGEDLTRRDKGLLKFGRLESGTVCNAVAGSACLEGSLRTLEDREFVAIREKLIRIAGKIESTTGAQCRLQFSEGYPPVNNSPQLLKMVSQIVPVRTLERPCLTTEDFSWYQSVLPGVFFLLGVGDTPALHSSDFQFDESVLEKGAAFFMAIAEGFDASCL